MTGEIECDGYVLVVWNEDGAERATLVAQSHPPEHADHLVHAARAIAGALMKGPVPNGKAMGELVAYAIDGGLASMTQPQPVISEA